MYLLDTNVISELRKNKPHGGVVAWLRSVRETDIYDIKFTGSRS
jgi:toxin FitB